LHLNQLFQLTCSSKPCGFVIILQIILDFIPPAYEDGTDGVFRNAGIYNSDAGELPKRKHNIFFRLTYIRFGHSFPKQPRLINIKYLFWYKLTSSLNSCHLYLHFLHLLKLSPFITMKFIPVLLRKWLHHPILTMISNLPFKIF
jgi:hypothetical protein